MTSNRLARTLITLAVVVIGAALCNCEVTVHKVPTPAQYDRWNDTLQAKADKMEGLRFYLPRPFVNVFESFPVSTDVYFVNGFVSPDGKFVHIADVRADSPLIELFASSLADGKYELEIDSANIIMPKGGAAEKPKSLHSLADAAAESVSKKLQGEVQRIATETKETSKKATEAAAGAKESAASARKDANRAEDATAPPKTGINKRTLTNNNGAFAYQPLRGNFDLVYLPDFDEQYVVNSKANLGNAEFEINLGQGWSLQGFNSLTDNSEVNKRVFDLIDTAISAAKAAAGAFIPGLPLAAGAVSLHAAEEDGAEIRKLMGTPVTLRIVIVHYAAKGLYPILKPRELLQQTPSVVVIDPFDAAPVAREVSELTDPDIQAAIERHRLDKGRYTVPVYPYQYISFNTFGYVAVELLTSTGAPFGTLYDATGTTGSPGKAQTTPLSPADESGTGGGNGDSDQDRPGSGAKLKEVRDGLNTEINATDGLEGAFAVHLVSEEPLTLGVRFILPEGVVTFPEAQREQVLGVADGILEQRDDIQSHLQIPISDEALALLKQEFESDVSGHTIALTRGSGPVVLYAIAAADGSAVVSGEPVNQIERRWRAAWIAGRGAESDASEFLKPAP